MRAARPLAVLAAAALPAAALAAGADGSGALRLRIDLGARVEATALASRLVPFEVGGAPGRAVGLRLSVGCRNADTREHGAAVVYPAKLARVRSGFRGALSLSQVWAQLPYPIDRAGIESKPMAIIEQQTHRSPYGLSESRLRQGFAAVSSYMLETAGHHYRLPLGDGSLDCRLAATALDVAGRRVGAARSTPFSVAFGRGLPAAAYGRDRALPNLSTQRLWAVDRDAPAVPPPAAAGTASRAREVAELRASAPRRARWRRLVRRWDDGSAVSPWIEVALDQIATHPSVDPPHAARVLALVSVAAHDSVVLAGRAARRYERAAPCRLDRRILPLGGCSATPSYPSEHAAVSGAAATILAFLFPDRAAYFRVLAAQERSALLGAGWSLPSDVDAGRALGRAVARHVVERARSDGSDAIWRGQVPRGPGRWRPTPPALDSVPGNPLAGTWRTWNISSGSALRPQPPPRPGSARFRRNVREVYRLTKALTTASQEIASFWEDKAGSFTPSGHWNAIALQLVRQRGLSTAQAALVFAALNTAQADAFVACWDAKYAYWTERPVTAIRAALDPAWSPYILTPSFPSYPSGHATTSGAASVVLARFFPREAAHLRALARQAGWSRVVGGIHFPIDNQVGLTLGRSVGAAALARIGASS